MLQALKKTTPKRKPNKRKAESKPTHHLIKEEFSYRIKPDMSKSIKHYRKLVWRTTAIKRE